MSGLLRCLLASSIHPSIHRHRIHSLWHGFKHRFIWFLIDICSYSIGTEIWRDRLHFLRQGISTERDRQALEKSAALSRVKGLGARKAQGSPPRDPNISI